MRPYLDNLTALRGIAATLVVVFHAHEIVMKLHPPDATHLVRSLYLMVDLFFVLSGFVMSYVYADAFSGGAVRGPYRAFMWARFARVYPLHLFTLLFLAALELVVYANGAQGNRPPFVNEMMSPAAWVLNALLLQAVGVLNGLSWNVPSWSISAEWWAYVLFPFLVPLLARGGRRSGFAMVAVGVAGWLGIEYGLSYFEKMTFVPGLTSKGGSLDVVWKFGALRGLAGFCVGMGVWRLWNLGVGAQWLRGGYALLLLFGLWAVSAHLHAPDTVLVTQFAGMVWVSANGGGGVDAFFNWKPLQRLGDWSYSIYMWHMPIFHAVTVLGALTGGPPSGDQDAAGGSEPSYLLAWGICMAWVGLSVLVGWLSYRYLETPARRWLRRA